MVIDRDAQKRFAPDTRRGPEFEMLTAVRRLRCWLAVLAAATPAVLAACVAPPDGVEAKQGAAVDVCASAPEGALCDDKNVCTIFDVCKAGVCKGSAAPNGTLCTDGNVCTANDSCRGGSCLGDAVPDTTACTDGDPCTVGDACKTGVCLPGAGMLACSDGIACTLDVCVAGLGCVFQPVGDCSVPKDGGPDAADAKVDVAGDAKMDSIDSATDSMMSGGDATSDQADAPAKDASPADLMSVDGTPPADAPTDSLAEAAVDALADAFVEVATDADADVDAGAPTDGEQDGPDDAGTAAPPDAKNATDAPADAGPPLVTLPLLRATGGACNCAASPSTAMGGTAWATILAALGAALASRRRRR
jgi:MYXO-CTERM domain-containing protein